MGLHVVNCQLKALKCDSPMSFMAQITCLVVDQKLRGLETSGWKCSYIEMIDWLPITSICIFAYNWWSSNDCYYVIKMSVNKASTILILTLSAIKGIDSHMLPKWLHWPFLQIRRKVTRSLPHPWNECQQCVNHPWSHESANENNTWSLWYLLNVLATFIVKNASNIIATIS